MSDSVRHQQTQEDFRRQLDEQIQFLVNSSISYDEGIEVEAKRLAASIRVLLYDTSNSPSLLAHLGQKNLVFLDTSFAHPYKNPAVMLSEYCLISVRDTPLGPRFLPHLDDVPWGVRWKPFGEWWGQMIYSDVKQRTFTREELICAVADRDSSARMDAKLERKFIDIERENLPGTYVSNAPRLSEKSVASDCSLVQGALFASVRQIAHEVVRTLEKFYTRIR